MPSSLTEKTSILFVFFSVTKRWSPSVLNPIWAGPTEAALRGKPLTIGLRRPFVPTRNPAIVSLPPTAAPLLSTYKTRRLTVRLMGCFPREGTVSTCRRQVRRLTTMRDSASASSPFHPFADVLVFSKLEQASRSLERPFRRQAFLAPDGNVELGSKIPLPAHFEECR